MPFRIPARVKMTSTTTGAGALTLIAPAANLRTFAAAFGASSRRVFYAIQGASYYEIGVGTFDGANALTRNTVLASSNGGAAVSLPVGTHDVFAWTPGGNAARLVASGSVTLTLADLFETIVWRGSANASVNLPDIATVPDFVRFDVLNLGTANLTIDPSGTQEVNDATTLVLRPGEGCSIGADPAGEWYAQRSALGLGAVLSANLFTALQTITVASGDALSLVSTDAGAAEGPGLSLFRDSASPAANDILGAIDFEGRSSTNVQRVLATLRSKLLDATNASEDAVVELLTAVAGTLGVAASVGQGLFMAGATGGDPGAGKINAADFLRNNAALPNQRRFQGAWTSITAGGLITQSHGLSGVPNLDTISLLIRNNSGGALEGWADQEIFPGPRALDGNGANSFGAFFYADATNVYAGIGANGLQLPNKTTRALINPTLTQWQGALVCYA